MVSTAASLARTDPKLAKVYAAVLAAQERAIAAIRPGVEAKAVDAAARSALADAGYEKAFTHGLGPRDRLAGPRGPRPAGQLDRRAAARHGRDDRAGRLPAGLGRRPDRGRRAGDARRVRTADHPAPRLRVGGGALMAQKRPPAGGPDDARPAAPAVRRADHQDARRADEPARPERDRPARGRAPHPPPPRHQEANRLDGVGPGAAGPAPPPAAAPAAEPKPATPAKAGRRHQEPDARHLLRQPQPRRRRRSSPSAAASRPTRSSASSRR